MNEPKTEYGQRPFQPDEKQVIQRLLEHKLGSEHIAVRPGAAGTKFVYVESWKAIELANSIFGFDGWSSQIVDITPDFIEELPGSKFRVGVTAVVKVMLKDGTFHEDVGYGICENKSKGTAIENAKKEAVSDARKRALRVFGNALGNCIYDKEHIKKIKTKIKPNATSTVSFEKLRTSVKPGNNNNNNNNNGVGGGNISAATTNNASTTIITVGATEVGQPSPAVALQTTTIGSGSVGIGVSSSVGVGVDGYSFPQPQPQQQPQPQPQQALYQQPQDVPLSDVYVPIEGGGDGYDVAVGEQDNQAAPVYDEAVIVDDYV